LRWPHRRLGPQQQERIVALLGPKVGLKLKGGFLNPSCKLATSIIVSN